MWKTPREVELQLATMIMTLNSPDLRRRRKEAKGRTPYTIKSQSQNTRAGCKSSMLPMGNVEMRQERQSREKGVMSARAQGLVWGSAGIWNVPLQLWPVVGDDKGGRERLEDQVSAFEDFAQSMIVAVLRPEIHIGSFQKEGKQYLLSFSKPLTIY